SGLVGIAAANGMLGPQYTPAALAAASQAGILPGYTTAAGLPNVGVPGRAQPGEDARSFAHRAMKPFFENQGFEVGDHQADRYGEHQNGALDIMVPSIDAGNAVLQQVLADPNVLSAGRAEQHHAVVCGPECALWWRESWPAHEHARRRVHAPRHRCAVRFRPGRYAASRSGHWATWCRSRQRVPVHGR
ncbi:MAG: hypothetical protein U5N53_12060, partial [Mycobacterium sp.]|nr:hypothetical protein [Mycobacterium sp.]